jgi:hypothetical protein
MIYNRRDDVEASPINSPPFQGGVRRRGGIKLDYAAGIPLSFYNVICRKLLFSDPGGAYQSGEGVLNSTPPQVSRFHFTICSVENFFFRPRRGRTRIAGGGNPRKRNYFSI